MLIITTQQNVYIITQKLPPSCYIVFDNKTVNYIYMSIIKHLSNGYKWYSSFIKHLEDLFLWVIVPVLSLIK